ncbi:TrkA C-terminal domain-containing protein [Natrinema salinisoli]|uniref:TrkA C-terminal domain-containing protein n=1 Tax=Natrinema salinisoli TaxID=2878535 RepID=UPI001CEFE6C9|nr:TrkA C-terminal domain-containing protein [Natrinema salinisoli]
MSLAASLFGHPVVEAVVHIGGLALLAGVVTAISAFVYRVRARTQFPEGPTLILGLGAVAIYLNTRLIFIQFIGNTGDALTVSEALLNISVFVTAGIASYGGRYAGDSIGTSKRLNWGMFQPDFNPIVRAVGRFITVTLPEEIDDIDGYDPVRDETKRAIAGETLEFPRGLTVGDLQSQLTARLKEDHDVGYVDVDLAADGTVEFLAVGQRAAGIGPTLPPNSAAVAVRADPPFSATAGDTVQLWRTDSDGAQARLGTAELRASVDDVTTVATDEAVAKKVDPAVDYRLMTLAADSHADREFAAMLRRGDETMSVFDVSAESVLVGVSVAALDATIIAIRSSGGDVDTIPKRDRIIQAGEQLFAIGRPETLRKLDAASGVQSVAESETPPAAGSAIDWESDTTTDRDALTYDGE